MLRFRLQDLPDHLRSQAEAQLAPHHPKKPVFLQNPNSNHPKPPKNRKKHAKNAPTSDSNTPNDKSITPNLKTRQNAVSAQIPNFADYNPTSVSKPPIVEFRGEPNKTEADYNTRILNGKGRYEAITLRLPGGNYTPDWMTIDDGVVTFHECKGGFRFASESRAILAFNEAAAHFPFWNFVWAQKQKGGKWVVKHSYPASLPLQPPPDNNIISSSTSSSSLGSVSSNNNNKLFINCSNNPLLVSNRDINPDNRNHTTNGYNSPHQQPTTAISSQGK